MEDGNINGHLPQAEAKTINGPLPQAEAKTQSPPVLAEPIGAEVEVTVAGTVENLGANGGGDGGGEVADDGGDGESGGVVGPEVTIPRKRGRPRKHQQLGLPDLLATPTMSLGLKRGRGRPPGSGRLQMLASLGELGDTAGGNLTPYTLMIQTGVDIAGVLSSFAQTDARSFCILSATGCVSIVDICPAGYFSSGIIRFKGHFELITLTGSYTCTVTGNVQREVDRLSVSLANPDGSVFGGTVVGSLVAATPIQLILGSFKQNIKLQLLKKHSVEPSTPTDLPGVSDSVRIPTPIVKSENVEQNTISTPNGDGCWINSKCIEEIKDQGEMLPRDKGDESGSLTQ